MKTACFASQTQGEIAVGQKKIIGSAQRQRGGRFLQHGSVLLAPSPVPIEELLGAEPPEEDRSSITLSEVRGDPVSYREVATALLASFGERFGVEWQRTELTPAEVRAASRLAESRYRFVDWYRKEVNRSEERRVGKECRL